MARFRQAHWDEPLLKEMSMLGRVGYLPPRDKKIARWSARKRFLPMGVERKNELTLPELSELQVLRHFNRLSQMNFSVESGMYPLGSCTMKYNPKVSEYIAASPRMKDAHPLQPDETLQGLLAIFHELSQMLAEITGMHSFSLTPAAGAQGEFAGVLMMKKYLAGKGVEKDEILVPDSAHGTNPASAAMAGFKVVKVASNQDGLVSANAVRAALNERTAGMMLTVPNTLGLFESEVGEISDQVHGAGGLMYYDGANMNALLGKARPGDMGFDIAHLNLHKTFATPHGGGGPGAGPVGVTRKLAEYLPVPLVRKKGKRYSLDYDVRHTIGKLKGSFANSAVLLRAYIYIRLLGAEGLYNVSSLSVLAANYLLKLLNSQGYALAHGKDLKRKHEAIVSVRSKLPGGAMKVAKALLDYGVHSPTVYFPLIVDEALMIEPTESETVESLDEYAGLLNKIYDSVDADTLGDVPHNTSVGRIDEVKASHPLTLKVKW